MQVGGAVDVPLRVRSFAYANARRGASQNTGVLVANDVSASRLPSLIANLARLGVHNSVVTCMDARKLPEAVRGVDRVLLDAPCTGLGVVAKDPSIKSQRTLADVSRAAHLQVNAAAAGGGGGGTLGPCVCTWRARGRARAHALAAHGLPR